MDSSCVKGGTCLKAGALWRVPCSFSLSTIRVDVFLPSIPILVFFRTTWNQDGNCIPILATLCLYCILQLAIFAFCPIYLRVHSLGRCWDSRHHAICSNTEFSFDLEPVPQFPSNSWHRAFVLHPSAWCLRLLSIYPYVEAFRRCWDSTHYSIYLNTFCSLDPEQARQQHPNLVCTRYPTSSWRYSQLH
jgi:hypothetical protein